MKKAILALTLLIFTTFCYSWQTSEATNSLKGLSAVGIRIDELPADALRCGIRANELEAVAKTVLEKSGIRVLDPNQLEATPGKPYLFISVGLISDGNKNACAIDLRISVRQQVKQVRDESIEQVDAATWNNYSLALTQPGLALQGIHLKLAGTIGFLVEDWCKANGKPLPKEKKKASI